jgi:hypothetical protein
MLSKDTEHSIQSGVSFTNILEEAYKLIDPKSVKKIDNLTVFFTLLGSVRKKAACRTLMKLTPARTTIRSQNFFNFPSKLRKEQTSSSASMFNRLAIPVALSDIFLGGCNCTKLAKKPYKY